MLYNAVNERKYYRIADFFVLVQIINCLTVK